MRKQYHFWPGETALDAWDVDRLIQLSEGFPVEQVALDAITEVDTVYWFDGDLERPTVRRIIDHVRLIQAVDLSYPVILSADGRVMDGMHRIARAILDDRPSIAAVRFDVDPQPDHRDCRPEDLPY